MSLAATVSKMTEEYGRDITYRRVINTAYDPTTRRAASTTTADYLLRAAVRNLKPAEIEGILQYGDREVKIAGDALPITPRKDDRIIVSGKVYRVFSVDDIVVKGVAIQYRLVVTGDAI